MSRVHLTLLGAFSITLDGREISLPTRKAAALLTFLALDQDQSRSRSRLADLLWSRSGAEQARQSLRQALFAIRKALGELEIFETDEDLIRLRPGLVTSDAAELLAARDGHADMERTTELYRGELLSEFDLDEPPFEHWLAARRNEVREEAIQLHIRRLTKLYGAGKNAAAIHAGLDLLQIDPLNEEAHRKLMLLYNRQGRVNEALRMYRELEDRLRQEMRIEPQAETRHIYEEILTGRQLAAKEPASPGQNILVVEDNVLQRKLISEILREDGFIVAAVDNGADALLEIGRSQWDLVLLDINLPMLDGLNILETIKRRDVPTKVILVSAEPAEKVEARALDLGASDFIQKPIRKDVLLARIKRVIGASS